MTATIFILALSAAMTSAFDTEGWTWQSMIEEGPETPGFVRLRLGADILSEARPDLNDLRILDEAGNLVPFAIRRERVNDEVREPWRDVSLVDRVFRPNEYVRVTADFGAPMRKNRLKIRLSDVNFRRRLLIEGGNDGVHWDVVLEKKWLFDISQPEQQFRADKVDFPVNTFRYLRLTAYHMPDDPRRIDFQSVQAVLREALPGSALEEVPVDSLTGPLRDNKIHASVYEIDLGFRNLPVARLRLKVQDPWFHRGYTLRGRNAATEEVKQTTETGERTVTRDIPWRNIRNGVLYRIEGAEKAEESVSLDDLHAPYRYLQLCVFDGDDAPLNIQEVSVFRHEVSLVFDYDPTDCYTVIGGKAKAQAPRFDLAKAVANLGDADLPVIDTGGAMPLEAKLPPWTDRHNILVWLALVAAMVVMLVLIGKNLRSTSRKMP